MLSNGQMFAGYRIVRTLGAGGMGEVYLAQHPRLARQDALKVLSPQLSADRDFARRFRREADLTASLWHPHIVGVHDAGEEGGRLWLSMDYVDGIDTSRLLKQHPAGVPVADVVEIVHAVAEALDFAHERHLLHRDVKPANILITAPGAGPHRILLADFGIARQADDISGLTATNTTLGTVSYAAPEQLMGEDIDGRADQYALAATVYHLLAGVPVFDYTNPAVVISRHLSGAPPPLSQHRPELAPLDPVFARALAKDPTDRFASCAEFAEQLKRGVAGERTQLTAVPPAAAVTPTTEGQPPRDRSPVSAQAPTQAAPVPAQPGLHSATTEATAPPRDPWSRRRLLALVAGAAALVAVTAVVAIVMTSGPRSTNTSPASTASAPPAPGPSPTVVARIPLPPSIASAGKIVVATNVPYTPAEFRASDGTLAGFDVDLVHAVAAELGVTAEIRELDFSQIIPAVMAGNVDVGMSAMTDTKQREQYVDMVNYYSAGILWAQRAGQPAIDPNAACGLRVAVQDTTTQQTDELPAKNQACVSAGKPPIEILPFYGQDQATNAVIAGDADAMSADSPVTAYAIKMAQGRLVAAGDVFDAAPYGWPVAGSPLGPALQQALQRLIDSGQYNRLLASWGVGRGAIQTATINDGIA